MNDFFFKNCIFFLANERLHDNGTGAWGIFNLPRFRMTRRSNYSAVKNILASDFYSILIMRYWSYTYLFIYLYVFTLYKYFFYIYIYMSICLSIYKQDIYCIYITLCLYYCYTKATKFKKWYAKVINGSITKPVLVICVPPQWTC